MRGPAEPEEETEESEEAEERPDDELAYNAALHEERMEHRAVGDYPNRQFRNSPDSEKLMPLLIAMARAAVQIPCLERMSLLDSIHNIRARDGEIVTAGDFAVVHGAPGQKSHLNATPADRE